VTLSREDSADNWGFSLAGGRGTNRPLSISKNVDQNSLAAKVGLLAGDVIISVSGTKLQNLSLDEGEDLIHAAGNNFVMVIERGGDTPGRKISFEKSAMTVSLKLGGGGTNQAPVVEKVDEAFISNNPAAERLKGQKVPKKVSVSKNKMPTDFNKTYNRKDWNCPWVMKDGSRLKTAMRAIDEAVAQAKTSHQHYYSEPRSILSTEPLLSPEQIQELIRQHGGDSRPQSAMQQGGGSRPGSAMQAGQNDTRHRNGNMYEAEMEAEIQEEMTRREDRNNLGVREAAAIEDEAYKNQLLVNSMLEQELHQMRMEEQMNMENSYYSEREADSQAPPDLEPVTPRNNSMTGDEAYEPSADELIDVLKNLENLAAANPQLYRSIVGQIKESQLYSEQQAYYEQQQQHQQQHQQQDSQYYAQEGEQFRNGDWPGQYEQVNNEHHQMYSEQVNSSEQMYMNEQFHQESHQQVEMTQEERYESEEVASSFVQEVKKQEINETEEEKKMRLKMERLEREANEQVAETLRKQREIKMAKLHPPEPPKPKEISVIAGDGKKVTITLGGETKEAEDNRKQVAEAAGLKHIPLPDYDDSSSAWAGSLKKTDRSKAVHEHNDDNPSWTGSLRHVKGPESKKNRRKDDESLYGAAPWMGTLRHVVHDNKVTKDFGVNKFQSKRYPDEDAGNPFEATGGCKALPAFPVTPAAIQNGVPVTRGDILAKEEEEELQRIKGNLGHLQKSETVSSALLKALMPKLLKAHESKYDPIDRDEASRIMEEILAMQVGLNVDQQADANEEAEMMIRAIIQEEVGGSVYSRMADDLEAAAQRRRKMNKSKKVKKVKEQKSKEGLTA